MDKKDNVNHPDHYTQFSFEAIDIILEVVAEFPKNVVYQLGNTLKYILRAPFKHNTIEDLKKGAWYLNNAIEVLEEEKEWQPKSQEDSKQ